MRCEAVVLMTYFFFFFCRSAGNANSIHMQHTERYVFTGDGNLRHIQSRKTVDSSGKLHFGVSETAGSSKLVSYSVSNLRNCTVIYLFIWSSTWVNTVKSGNSGHQFVYSLFIYLTHLTKGTKAKLSSRGDSQ